MAEVDRGPEPTEENPLLGYKARFAREWPGPARLERADVVFPDGWQRTALRAARAGAVPPLLLDALAPEERATYERLAAERRTLAAHLLEREATTEETPRLPSTVSVGGIVTYGRCPKRFYWSHVRPLPRFSGPAARIGTEIHAWIERRSSGQTTLLELEEQPDLMVEELAGEPGKIDRLKKAFLESRFADATPRFAERPFLLPIEGFFIAGRIDAIYGVDEGPWEIVDYKTGRRPAESDPLAGLQLDLYALACVDVWGKRAEDLTLTYLYLASGEEVSRPAGDPDEVRTRVGAWLRAITAGEFEPAAAQHCTWCDFLPFCDAGRAAVGGGGASG
jgi:DNA helicase-2/ATP-dependent DNA helicase PcrA